MTRKTQILLVTHLFALTLGYGVVRKAASADEKNGGAPEYTKLAARGLQPPSGDGYELLADFLAERSGKDSKFEELMATLPVAQNPRGAVVSAVEGLGGGDWREILGEDEQAERLAEVKVRVWQWMKENPVEAMSFILNDPACEAAGLPGLLDKPVFRRIAAENGVLKSVGWLVKSEVTFGSLCQLTLDEMRAGGGFALFEKVDGAILRSPNRSEFRAFRAEPLASDNPADDGERYLRLVGAAARFEEKDRLLERVKRMRAEGDKLELLSGFAAASGPAAEWLLALLKSGGLKGIVADESLAGLDRVVLGVAALDMEQRLEILRADLDSEGKSRQELVNELVAADVMRLLENGRDWRFGFRHGKVTLDTLSAAVRAGLPALPESANETLRVTLYRQLAEESPKRALPLLDGFPPAKRREVLLDSTWLSHANVSPDDFLRFLTDVPDAATPEEQASKLKGWNIKARGNLWRYGDDYVEWVKKMPPGIHREAAIHSVILATAEQNPAQARVLSEQFYPQKP